MARVLQQDTPLEQFTQDSFSGGINTRVPQDQLTDNEALDIINFEYDLEDNLVTRTGVSKALFPGVFYASKITSIHYYENDAGNLWVLYTSSNKLYKALPSGGSGTDITGALTFPTDTFWMWRNFNGIAIGVNKATSGTNPVKVSGAVPTVTALGGTPPYAKFIEVWNNRVWLVSATSPNTIHGSKLGDPEDWTAAGASGAVTIDISKNDGDQITGMIAFRERLFIFKRTKIFIISPNDPALPITDATNLRVDIFANNIGCVSAYSIQSVLDDVLFLSDSGVASLVSSQVVGDFQAAIISRNVSELQRLTNTDFEVSSVVLPEKDQYWLFVPAAKSPRGSAEVYILDYKRIQNGQIRWFRFTGLIAGWLGTIVYNNGIRSLWLSGFDGTNYRIYKYSFNDSAKSYNDDGAGFLKRLITKAYDSGSKSLRKRWHSFMFGVEIESATAQVTANYTYDQVPNKTSSYSFNLSSTTDGAFWDVDLWDTGIWDAGQVYVKRIGRMFKKNSYGQKAVNMFFDISNNQVNEAITFKFLTINFSRLTERRARNA